MNAEAIAQAKRWYWQRLSAMVLALCVLVHLAVMVYAGEGEPAEAALPQAMAVAKAVAAKLQ